MFNHILLSVDGSEHGMRAAKTAGDLARAVDAEELRVVVAYEPVPAYLGEPNLSNAMSARVLESDGIIKTALEQIGEIPGEIQTESLPGSPAEVIVDVASTRNSDVIVMGSRGLGRLAGALLGSNAQKVVSHASCPVLIVR